MKEERVKFTKPELLGRGCCTKVFNYETPLERVLREIDIGCQVNSLYVVHYDADPGHWNNERFCRNILSPVVPFVGA